MPESNRSLGDAVGRYRLIGEIARGGMGIVYVAAAQGPAGFSKLVALKELRPDLVEDDEFLTMFLEEARMAARLNHPNIVQTNDVDEHSGRHFIAMEYLEGRSLYHVLKRFAARGGFPQRMAVSVLRDALSALDYAHEVTGFDGKPLGFVHRDVSPHNIFLTYEGHTKVIDFGIAKAKDSSLETRAGVLKGRANYMAPEQLTRGADRRSDIFSIGAVMYEILAGRRLWQGKSEVEILAALTRGEIPSLAQVRPDTPAELVEICQRALAARAEERYATAAEMRDALDQWLWSTGGAPRLRDVSDALMQEFDSERQRTRALVEAALYRLQAGEGGRLETFSTPDQRDLTMDSRRGSAPGGTGSGRSISQSYSSSGSMRREVSRVGSLPSRVTQLPPVAATSAPNDPPPHVGSLLLPLGTPTSVVRRRQWIVGGALGLVFLSTTLAVALHRGGATQTVAEPVALQPAGMPAPVAPATVPAPSAPAAPVAAPTPAPAPAPAAPETIVFSVGVTPSTAQVLIDGQPMPSNPFVGRFPKSPATHRVRAVAPGYQPKERLVSFDDNVMIDLSLTAMAPVRRSEPPPRQKEPPARRSEPVARRAEAPPPAVAPAPVVEAPARPASNDIAPRGEYEPRRRRAIDTNNPYGEDK